MPKNTRKERNLMVVSIVLAVLLFVILIISIWLTRRRRREAVALAEAGTEMRAAFAGQLQTIVPHIYNRLELTTEVPKVRLWQRLKLKLVIRLLPNDIVEIESMTKKFLNGYLARPDSHRLLVSVSILPLEG